MLGVGRRNSPFSRFYEKGRFLHENWIIFGQNIIISSHSLITNQLQFDSGLFIKLKGRHIVEKENPLNHL